MTNVLKKPRDALLPMNSLSPNDPLDPSSLGRGLLRRAVYFFAECESTNTEARRLAEQGEAEGALVLADFQTAGRGRLERAWHAPRGSSLLFSMLLRPALAPGRALLPVMAAALGVMEGIRRVCNLNARLKWPNDILLDGGKAGGILCEGGFDGPALKHVIVGIGLNVNFTPRTVAGIPPDAASIQSSLGRPQPRAALLRAILEEIESRYELLLRGESLRDEWARALDTLGRRTRIILADGDFAGMAESVDESGALILRLDDGSRRIVPAGDAIHLRSDDRR
jgi:BirA family biotin operon repressor/biotin-[acetyl-CoA-carboxylase] ligase